jgi:hypothetical protein
VIDADARPSSAAPLSPAQRRLLVKEVRRGHELARLRASQGALQYLNEVVIDRAGGPARFADVAEPWQWLLASRVAPALDAIAGVRRVPYEGPRSFWFTLPRGHDKTSQIARLCSWLLAFSRYALRGVVAAADREQSGLLAEFMAAEARLNPWLSPLLKFGNWKVEGLRTGSRMKVLAADSPSSFGLKEDVIVLDELTHWGRSDLWDTLVSGREKRPGCVLIIISNSGIKRSWQHKLHLEACNSPQWYTYSAPPGAHLASWMNRQKIDELRRMLPPLLARRVLGNEWVDEREDCGFVTWEEAKACEDGSLGREDRGRPGVTYAIGVDYAPVRDGTGLCVCHLDDEANVVLDRLDVMQGSAERRVPIQAVESWIDNARRDFPGATLVADPYSLESTLQSREGVMDVVRFEPRAGKANYELAANLRSLIVNRRLRLYPEAGGVVKDGRLHTLVDELSELHVEQRPAGWRIQHSASGHDDRTVAVGMAALHLCQTRGRTQILTSGRWF